MENYLKEIREMYSQFKKKEPHPLEKYIGRHAVSAGNALEVVGYVDWTESAYSLIVDASPVGGWERLGEGDVVFKECSWYQYVRINDLID